MSELSKYLHEANEELHAKLEEQLQELGEDTVKLLVDLGYTIAYDSHTDEDGNFILTAEFIKEPTGNSESPYFSFRWEEGS